MGFLSGLLGGAQSAPQAAGGSTEAVMGFPSVNYGGQDQPRPKKAFRDSGFANILGMLGDALLVHGGRSPMYAPMRQQRMDEQRQEKANQAIGNYLGNLDPALRELIMQAGPGSGMKAYEMAHPQAKDPPSFVREFEYREGLDPERRKSFDGYAGQRKFNPYAPPLEMNDGDRLEYPGEAGEVTATGPNGEKVRYNPQTGAWEPMGGPTAGPSGGFL